MSNMSNIQSYQDTHSSQNIKATLEAALLSDRITQSEYDLHQRLASELARLIENGADDAEIASIHSAMLQILKKAE